MPAPTATLTVRAYLRMRAASCVTPGGDRGLVLSLRDMGGLFPDGITAYWLGSEASDFLTRNQVELTAGRCLDLEIYNLHAVKTDLRGHIKTCQLAPLAPSWINHAKKATHPAP